MEANRNKPHFRSAKLSMEANKISPILEVLSCLDPNRNKPHFRSAKLSMEANKNKPQFRSAKMSMEPNGINPILEVLSKLKVLKVVPLGKMMNICKYSRYSVARTLMAC